MQLVLFQINYILAFVVTVWTYLFPQYARSDVSFELVSGCITLVATILAFLDLITAFTKVSLEIEKLLCLE